MPSFKRARFTNRLYHLACVAHDKCGLVNVLTLEQLSASGAYSQTLAELMRNLAGDCQHAGSIIPSRICTACYHSIVYDSLQHVTTDNILRDRIADTALQLATASDTFTTTKHHGGY